MQIRINNLSKSFGNKILFENTSCTIQPEEKIAIIGQNGTGKTTLIKCIQGEEEYQGTIEVKENISIMEQEKKFNEKHKTFQEYLDEKFDYVEQKKQQLETKLGDQNIYEDEKKFTRICNEYELLCKQIQHKIHKEKLMQILKQLEFPEEKLKENINTLSGGQKTKLRLAEVLATNSKIIILDEPTNHLDLKTRNYLENYLQETNKTILVISHDRYFLKKIVTKVIEIENKQLQVYNTNYNNYIQQRNQRWIALEKEHHATQKKKQKLLQSAKQKREWAHLQGNIKLKQLADRLQRNANNLKTTIDVATLKQHFEIKFNQEKQTGNIIYTLKKATKNYHNKQILQNINLEIQKKQRIAIIGDNGTGKTTLLKILASIELLTTGTKENGFNLEIGYFDQELTNVKTNQKLLDFFLENFPNKSDQQIAKLAISLGFENSKFKTKIKLLSGGEKARLNLIRLTAKNHNVLLLDEPTNNLDLELTQMLEKALQQFPGTVIFVSHDRQFIDNVATHLIEITKKQTKMNNGNYSANFF